MFVETRGRSRNLDHFPHHNSVQGFVLEFSVIVEHFVSMGTKIQ